MEERPILVAGADEMLSWAVAEALRKEGYETVVATSSEETLDLLAEFPAPAIIFADRSTLDVVARRPGSEGEAPVVPIVVFSEAGEVAPETLRSGMMVLTKPVHLGDLIALARSLRV